MSAPNDATPPTPELGGLDPRQLLEAAQRSASLPPLPQDPGVTLPVAGPRASLPNAPQEELPLPEELTELLPAAAYKVEGFLGAGGMGAVYKGMQVRLKRPVAIKIMRRDMGRDHDFEARFEREAQAMAKLNHPNIVSVIDYGEAGPDYLYIVMELIDGADLMDVIRGGQMTQMMAMTLLPQICDALQFAHEHGIVHRDIKPSNIMVTRDGRVKMADFGLAKHFDAENSFRTQTGTGMGTPDYAAPEQFDPKAHIDHRADIYALGVMIYQMITGQLPRGVWKAPSERAEVAPQWDEIVSRAMQSDPADRYQHASQIKTDVSGIMLGAKVIADTPARTAKLAAASVRRKEAVKSAPAPVKSRVSRVIGLNVVAAIVVTGTFFVIKQQDKIGTSSPLNRTSTTKITEGPAAIKLWDTPDKIRMSDGRSWENNAVLLDDKSLFTTLISVHNVVFRADVRMNSDASEAQINVRSQYVSEDNCDYYTLGFTSDSASILLTSVTSGQRKVIRVWPLPRPYGTDEWLTLELRAVGHQITACADGQVLGTIQDTTVTKPGGLSLFAKANGYFRNIEYVNLDGLTESDALRLLGMDEMDFAGATGVPATAKASQNVGLGLPSALPSGKNPTRSASPLEPGAIRLLDAPESLDATSGAKMQNGVLVLTGTRGGYVAYGKAPSRDTILRASVHMTPELKDFGMRVRHKGLETDGFYNLSAKKELNGAVLLRLYHGVHMQLTQIKAWTLPRTNEASDWLPLELHAIGEELTVYADGQKVGAVRDTQLLSPGNPAFFANHAEVRDIVYVPLDKSDATPTGNATVATAVATDEKWVDGLAEWWNKYPSGKFNNAETMKREGSGSRIVGNIPIYVASNLHNSALRVTAQGGDTGWLLSLRALNGAYEARIGKDGQGVVRLTGSHTETVLASFTPPAGFRLDDRHTAEFRCINNELTFILDGKELARVRHQSKNWGDVCFEGKGVLLERLDYLYLPQPKPEDVGKPSALPGAIVSIPGLPDLPPLTLPPGEPGFVKQIEIPGGYVHTFALLPDSRRLLVFQGGELTLLDLETQRPVWRAKAPGVTPSHAMTPDGSKFVHYLYLDDQGKGASQASAKQALITLRSSADGAILQEWRVPVTPMSYGYGHVALSPSGKRVAARVGSGHQNRTPTTHASFVALEVGREQPIAQWVVPHNGHAISCLDEDRYLSTGDGDAVLLSISRPGQGEMPFPSLGLINQHTLSPDRKVVVAVGPSGTLAQWELGAAKVPFNLDQGRRDWAAVTFAGRDLVAALSSSASDPVMALGVWERISGKKLATFSNPKPDQRLDASFSAASNGTFCVVRAKRHPTPPGGGPNILHIYRLPKPGEVAGAGGQVTSPTPPGAVPAASASSATKDAPFVNSLGMKFVPVPIAGGPTGGERVLFSVWETRVQDYEVFVKDSWKKGWTRGAGDEPKHPVRKVSWEGAQTFCAWLTERERKLNRLDEAEAYRLPTDHEWSCAVGLGEQEDLAQPVLLRGKGLGEVFPWGKAWPPPPGVGNYAGEEFQEQSPHPKWELKGYRDPFVALAPVGSFPANALGLHDLGGNIWEWCEDLIPSSDPPHRVRRGSSFDNGNKGALWSIMRGTDSQSASLPGVGFRVVLAPAIVTPPAPAGSLQPVGETGAER